MTEPLGAPADVLLQRPWLPVNISGCQLLTKSWFGETAYHVLLTDMQCVWEERMDSAAIQSRAQELNRRLRAPVKAFFSHLCEVVQPCLSDGGGGGGRADGGEAQISLTRQEDGDISMRLKSELAGLPFYWEFHCTPAPVTLVCVQLLRPLLAMSRLLQRQVEQLGGLLVRKDAEIQDYRENGATLSRERLQTDAFNEQIYKEDFMSKVRGSSSGVLRAAGLSGLQQRPPAAVPRHRRPRQHTETQTVRGRLRRAGAARHRGARPHPIFR
ncbi:non-homologous end-joining factor 1 isoform X4 [Thunnus albacares]|uniref:non-homologous end-joining factor 1 isoform X4 n=1 Tax=Thunnus albacares TaxID=8236 RepID=UPI001CF70256|nr:non-homologous end-joining factor 1 isoform X4 [Thunnus albacares]